MVRYEDEDETFDEDFKDEEFADNDISPEEAIDDDEIDELEEGFMEGYEEGERSTHCSLCKAVLDIDYVEEDINGETYRFCSEAHADAFKRKQESQQEED